MKALRITLVSLTASLLLALTLAGGLWLWSGASTSMATSISQLARSLPAGQTLEARDVIGSLRGGGSIGWLRWHQGALSVELREITLAWSLRPLLSGELRLGQLAAKSLAVDDRRPPSAPGAATPPASLSLPLKIDVPFKIDAAEWVRSGNEPVRATGLSGHYIFDSAQHLLNDGQVAISSGNYQIKASVGAQAPMALHVEVDGTVQTTLPSSPQPLTVQAHATLTGPLAGADATLVLQAELLPQINQPLAKGQQAMQGRVDARIQPWQVQPLAQLEAQWQALDVATLWPQAPKTHLAGTATITPNGAGWLAGVQLTNTLGGPWNLQRLPLEQLNAKLAFLEGQWMLQTLQARGAGGRAEATGQFKAAATSQAAQWAGRATLAGVQVAALDSRLEAVTLDGLLTAKQMPTGIAFEAQLQPTQGTGAAKVTPPIPGKSTLQGLRIKTAQVQGLWNAPLLTLNQLQVQTDDAVAQGKLSFDTASQAAQGQLSLDLPGAKVLLAGNLASARGEGELNLTVSDAALATRWATRLPGAPPAVGQTLLEGNAQLTGRWQGGWQQQGQGLQIQAKLQAPKLDWRERGQPAEKTLRLREAVVDVSGTLAALSLSTQSQLETGTQRLALQAQVRGGRQSEGLWQAQLNAAQVTLQDTLKPGTWRVELGSSVNLTWKQSGTGQTLETTAGSARLTGPAPGTATVTWQPVRWSQQGVGATQRTDWRTQGRLADLPLAWLDLLGQTQMANLGLRGDLMFGGQWDASSTETLRVRATLERTGGDLLLQTDASAAATLRAGVREARLVLTTDGDQMGASLRWDSERAGQIQADVNTRLQRLDGGWTWPADAALAGTLKVQLPPVGVWSLLAPPGWRLRGTLDANAVLSGTRSAPQWRGNLAAQDLAMRSVVDGIDFSQGTLRASLQGQQLTIDQFTLQGAGGASGGLLSATGSVEWLPSAGPPATAASRVRMDIEATAKALRLSARADRRLVVSGTLSAKLHDAKLTIGGALKADSALFILPEDTAPRLGDDVLVRVPDKGQSSPATATKASAAPTKDAPIAPNVAITLDLGPDFLVRGRGLSTRLAGNLTLRSAGANPVPSLTGSLRTVRGTYKAYGQQLDIDRGVLRFYGPIDNPALEILAIRPNLQQRVGVQISGTALSPVVRLYADPDLPDAEKLAWLVVGRSGASGGAESALLQQAAMALLGGSGGGLTGNLATAIGLDEISFSGGLSGTAGASVTLGKRVSRDFYMAYERSLAGTLGTLYIFYDLSRRLTLRAQTGEQSAIDLIFTIRYD
jgi:translocation and assembly module TamB